MMFAYWEFVAAVVGLLTVLFTLWKLWIQKLYEQIERQVAEIGDLRRRHDPKIEIERDDLRREIKAEKLKAGELSNHLLAKQEEITTSRIAISRLKEQLNGLGERNKENVRRGNANARIAKQWRDIAEKHEGTITQLGGELEQARRDCAAQVAEQGRLQDAALAARLDQAEEKRRNEIRALVEERDRLNKQLAEKIEDGEYQLKKIQELDSQVGSYQERDERILNHEGRVWERPVVSAPPFIPLGERKAIIISILNLKGGVGKTTLTANLAAALGHTDSKKQPQATLVVDLDYQRTLTKLCCTRKQLEKAHGRNECIQHFFLKRTRDEIPPNIDPGGYGKFTIHSPLSREFLNSAIDVIRNRHWLFKIVACSEDSRSGEIYGTLDDTEMHLFAEWLIGSSDLDVRFRLRKAIHTELVWKDYKYILFDCPPRLSLACINALAASDFVLVPVLPDETSAISVPLLLQKIKRLSQVPGLLPSLKVLGIVANKVQHQKGELVKYQKDVWKGLPNVCKVAWGETVHPFASMIPLSRLFGEAAGKDIDPKYGKEMEPEFAASFNKEARGWFTNLIDEMEKRIQHERDNPATVSTESHQPVESK